jgi:alpha-ketoglutarate-dependent taurine dioxygenase
VKTRFLHKDERLVLSNEREMPLVIEATCDSSLLFLQEFMRAHSTQLLEEVAQYGAVLFRGFDIQSDDDFEKAILSIQGLNGISDAFMSEEGRVPAGSSQFVLHTNAVYKTGGTMYLGGFHSENYYSPDVPSYISFCCLTPSTIGGETGLVNMKKVYQQMDDALKKRLEDNSFFAAKWLVSDAAKRYQCSTHEMEQLCRDCGLPLVGEGDDKFIFMYKPSVLSDPLTQEKALFINLFEIHQLNTELRKRFMDDYAGSVWFWHRFVWKLPKFIFKSIKTIYMAVASFFYSPKDSIGIFLSKIRSYRASKKIDWSQSVHDKRVGSCFSGEEVKHLATLIRQEYSSFLWKKGDVVLVDNRQVMHAGMPGSGVRLVRALIANPLAMTYTATASGLLVCKEKVGNTIGSQLIS